MPQPRLTGSINLPDDSSAGQPYAGYATVCDHYQADESFDTMAGGDWYRHFSFHYDDESEDASFTSLEWENNRVFCELRGFLERRVVEQQLEKNWSTIAAYFLYEYIRVRNSSLSPKRLYNVAPALVERHNGSVTRVSDVIVAVEYGEGETQFELEYPRSQFREGIALKRGDVIEAGIAVWREENRPKGIDYYLSPEEQAELDSVWKSKKGVVGDLTL